MFLRVNSDITFLEVNHHFLIHSLFIINEKIQLYIYIYTNKYIHIDRYIYIDIIYIYIYNLRQSLFDIQV